MVFFKGAGLWFFPRVFSAHMLVQHEALEAAIKGPFLLCSTMHECYDMSHWLLLLDSCDTTWLTPLRAGATCVESIADGY